MPDWGQVPADGGWGEYTTVLMPFFTWVLLKVVPGTMTVTCLMGGKG